MNTLDADESTPLVPRHGIPPPVTDERGPLKKTLAIYLILACTLLERVAFYSIMVTLVLNLDSDELFHWQPRNSSIASFIFSGTSYISTLIFAVIGDAKLGRAITILVGFVLYVIGYILAVLITKTNINICARNTFNESDTPNTITIIQEPCASWILVTLIIIAIGAGAVQSNMAVFGADQVQQSDKPSRYFDKYIVVVNIGGIIATLGINFIQKDANHYFIGYLVALIILLIAAVLFSIGWRCYINVKPYDTVVSNCIPVVINAFQSWLQYKHNKRSISKYSTDASVTNSISDPFSLTEGEDSMGLNEQPKAFLDYAKIPNNGNFHDRIVNDVKSLGRALIVFSLLIPYWLVYHQARSVII
ncbi:unnamed protein product [Rotaria sp. Silwood1]|nr:unnamed protein product [Rotaria sp. Silwood1]